MGALVKVFLASTFLLVVIAALILAFVGRQYHVYSWRGWQVYRAMGRECHPVWPEYNFRRIRAGDNLDDVIAKTNPVTMERDGRWVTLGFQTNGHFTGISATAFDGKMVFACAWSCSWVRLFFDELSEEQSLEYLGRSKSDPRRLGIVPVYRS